MEKLVKENEMIKEKLNNMEKRINETIEEKLNNMEKKIDEINKEKKEMKNRIMKLEDENMKIREILFKYEKYEIYLEEKFKEYKNKFEKNPENLHFHKI